MSAGKVKIGIIGAGFIGRALAQLCVQSGFDVMVSNSRGPQTLTSTMVALRCRIGSAQTAAKFGNLVIVAIPFGNYTALPVAELDGKIVLDANNYYPPRDGSFAQLDNFFSTTSELLQAHLPGARVVKAFNAILERHIGRDARPAGDAERRALPICGDDLEAKQAVAELHDALGFDTVDAGALAQGWRFERDRPAYCVKLDTENLRRVLAETGTSAAEGLWFKKA